MVVLNDVGGGLEQRHEQLVEKVEELGEFQTNVF
jgi:hypothetical protein